MTMWKLCRLGCILIPLTLGCSGNQGQDMASVRGKVTYQGKPLAHAQVVFMPETPNKLPASGMTDANGQYELMTIVPGDGATIGKQRVTITARDNISSNGAMVAPGETAPMGKALIPQKYFMPDSSGLTAEVKSGGITADFELKDE